MGGAREGGWYEACCHVCGGVTSPEALAPAPELLELADSFGAAAFCEGGCRLGACTRIWITMNGKGTHMSQWWRFRTCSAVAILAKSSSDARYFRGRPCFFDVKVIQYLGCPFLSYCG